MGDTGEPKLIIQGTASPHTFSLRPSDARNVQGAEVIFLIGDALETSLVGSVETLGRNARVVRMAETEGLVRLALREGATFEGHVHEAEDAEDAHGHHDDGHEAHEDGTAGHEDDHAVHGDEAFDMHIWLDPHNARVMVRAIAQTLAGADPDNASTYESNADAVDERLVALLAEIKAEAAQVRGRPFIVFHDAYHYFESRFGLSAAGSASVSPERPPGARRIGELRDRARELGVVCVLAEPQFDPGLANLIIEGTPARLGSVDPLGAALESGPDTYFELMRAMSASFVECLADG